MQRGKGEAKEEEEEKDDEIQCVTMLCCSNTIGESKMRGYTWLLRKLPRVPRLTSLPQRTTASLSLSSPDVSG